jgi:septal ring factor EnvC (AmiA/AmiB activator)
MLVRISLIIAIIAAVAVGVLNFTQLKPKIAKLETDLDTETKAHQEFLTKFNNSEKALAKTNAILKQTIATLEATTSERDKAVTDLAAQTKRADKLNEDLTKTRAERDSAQQDLAAYKATGMTPEQISHVNKDLKDLRDALTGTQDENKLLGKKIAKLQNELNRYVIQDYHVPLPAGLRGKVLITDPKWNFVVLNIGEEQGVQNHGELLVNRNGRLVGKVIVNTVHKDQSIANVMPGWELGEVMEGDQVIPAYPAS